jgi:hypothetical protein
MASVRGIWVCLRIRCLRSGSGVSFSNIDLVTSTQFTINQEIYIVSRCCESSCWLRRWLFTLEFGAKPAQALVCLVGFTIFLEA